MTSSPHYTRSNGFIERSVKYVKGVTKKTQLAGDDINRALLSLRATPVDADLPSPGEMIQGRRLTTLLPNRDEPGPEKLRDQLAQRRDAMVQHHDQACGYNLPPLRVGQRVRVQNRESNRWFPATIAQRCTEPCSYVITIQNGTMLRRNRSHLRELEREEHTERADTIPARYSRPE